MTGPQEHVRFEELAVGHALSALEPEEEQRFVEHLATCTACQRELPEHQETLSLLALSADPVAPPPSVLAGIRTGMAAGPRAAPADSALPARPAGVASLDERRRSTHRGLRWVGAAAAAALVLSLGAWSLSLRSERDDARAYGDRLAVAVRDLAQPGSTSVRLAGDDGTVLAVAVEQDDRVSLVVDGLQPNAGGTSYVLWAQGRDGGVRPVGAFDVEQAEVDVVDDLPVEGGVRSVTAYLVSNEQGDEAPPAPSGQIIASGEA